MPLGVGCDSLIKLADHDAYFNSVCMVLDADTTVDTRDKKYHHITILPGDSYKNPKPNDNKELISRPLSPERTVLQYLIDICNNPDSYKTDLDLLLAQDVTTVFLQEYILHEHPPILADRKKLKSWWKRTYQYIDQFKVIETWAITNKEKIEKYHRELENSLRHVRYQK